MRLSKPLIYKIWGIFEGKKAIFSSIWMKNHYVIIATNLDIIGSA